MSKISQKRCVLFSVLIYWSSIVEQNLKSGRELQSLGAAKEKDLSPNVSVLAFGTVRKLRLLSSSQQTSNVWNSNFLDTAVNTSTSQSPLILTTVSIHRVYYTVAQRYGFYLQVVKTIFYEWAFRMSIVLF